MSAPRKTPLILDVDEAALPEVPAPAEAPPVGGPPAAERMLTAAAPRRGGLGRWLLGVLLALILLWAGVAATEFVTGLFARYAWLGWVGVGLLGLLVVLLVAVCLRELAALARIGRIEGLRRLADEARDSADTAATDRVMAGLARLYRGRPDLEWAEQRLAAARGDTPDAAGRLDLAEQTLMAPLDKAAEAAVTRAARDVAATTALIPLALIDVLAALTCNLRMIREIAQVYGGRAGWLGSWRLMRAVAAHLIATGAVSVADDLVGPLVGGGVLAKLSRRFGEGALNGALTARIGVSTIEICRPLPFHARTKPKASALVLSALSSWRRQDKSVDPAAD
ncbi:MAG: TIGR01620 family protein [Pseudomonadota bacterium]